MPNPHDTTYHIVNMNSSTKNAQIELAIADLNQQDKPNVLATAKKYALVESTLRRRWKGKSMSQEAASSEYKQRPRTGTGMLYRSSSSLPLMARASMIRMQRYSRLRGAENLNAQEGIAL